MDGIAIIPLISVFWNGLLIAFVLGLVFGFFRRALYWVLKRSKK